VRQPRGSRSAVTVTGSPITWASAGSWRSARACAAKSPRRATGAFAFAVDLRFGGIFMASGRSPVLELARPGLSI
jgi:hypothetical protein